MKKVVQKFISLNQKIIKIFSLFFDKETSFKVAFSAIFHLFRYGFGQVLAYTGIGKMIPFKVREDYLLYLSQSPVAMVLYGDSSILRDEERVAKEYLRSGDTCLDIGANIASFSLFASRCVGNTGSVFAFEAHPKTSTYARKNILLNKTKNITVVENALGEKTLTVFFSDDNYDDINHVQDSGGVKTKMIRLDDYAPLQSVKVISFIKLDVEGYELFVLRGAEKTLKKTKYVLFEVYEKNAQKYNYSAEDVYNFFIERGFSVVDPETKSVVDKVLLKKETIQNLIAINKSLSV